MRKYLIFFYILLFLFNSQRPVLAEQSPQVLVSEGIIVGYWEEWLHSDGETWQDTDHDGDYHAHQKQPHYDECSFFINVPEEITKSYNNILAKVIPFKAEFDKNLNLLIDSRHFNKQLISQIKSKNNDFLYEGLLIEEPTALYVQCQSYGDFQQHIIKYIPPDFSEIDNNKFNLYTGGNWYDVTHEWQNKKVQGRRWLLPFLVQFYGTPKVEAPPEPKEPEQLPCKKSSSITRNWQVLYTWEVYHSSTCTDEDGEEYDCSWTETKWSMPTYTEELRARVVIDTKQGEAQGGRESRGSWDIIPYSQENGLNPNEVTRAGYGFEVKVSTNYSNDWESKVPAGATPKGDIFQGPKKVSAEFYNTDGYFVEKIDLEPTSGKAGEKEIIWRLPPVRYDFPDGTSVWERKHYTDVNNRDGSYLVRIIVSEAGRNDMCLIREEKITIHGDMYDDMFTRPSESINN